MSNTLGGVNLAQVAQQSLDALVAELPSLNMFTTDFSADVVNEGASVSTRVATQPTSGSLATGYAANVQGGTTTVKTVTLGDVSGLVLGFTDSEWSKSHINLIDVFIKPGVNAIAGGMIADVLALVTNANFSTAAFVGAASVFDSDDVADIATALTTAKVPKRGRGMILNPTYFAALLKDDSVKASMFYGGSEAIRNRQIPSLMGFSPVVEFVDLPDNSENLVGVAGGKQGLIIAARVPAIPDGFPGEIANVTDPDSGLTLQLRKWYSADDGKHYMSMGLMYGVAVGVAGYLKRLTSA